jgi:hypothetical protein
MAYANAPGNQTDKQSRNTFVAAQMYAIDMKYKCLFRAPSERKAVLKQCAGRDLTWPNRGYNQCPHAEAVKTTLAAISTAAFGAKIDIDQDIYMAQPCRYL